MVEHVRNGSKIACRSLAGYFYSCFIASSKVAIVMSWVHCDPHCTGSEIQVQVLKIERKKLILCEYLFSLQLTAHICPIPASLRFTWSKTPRARI